MSKSNTLIISDSGVKFEGFDAVTDIATVCFYPGRIAILSKYPDEKLDCHYCVNLDHNKEAADKNLVEQLRKRGLGERTEFLDNDGTYFDISDMQGS